MRFLISILAFLLLSTDLFSFSGGGSGSEEDPYQITTVEQLQEMNTDEAHLSAHYILMNDIDAGDTRNWNFGDHDQNADTPDSAMGFVPVGNGSAYFTGCFNGQNYEIEGLYIYRPMDDNIGLFGFTYGENVQIKNIELNNVTIFGGCQVGGVAGHNYYGNINNIEVSGNIYGRRSVGGIIGANYCIGTFENLVCEGKINIHYYYNYMNTHWAFNIGGLIGYNTMTDITHSHTSVNIECVHDAGGLIGSNSSGNISHSYATGHLMSTQYGYGSKNIGGLIGENNNGYIYNCYAGGDVYGYRNIGGLIGSGSGMMEKVYATGDVHGKINVGGLLGTNSSRILRVCAMGNVIVDSINGGGLIGYNDGVIENCYARGQVSGGNRCGGLIGYNLNGSVYNAYSTGEIISSETMGGLVALFELEGGSYGIVSNSFWDLETSLTDSSAGGTGLETRKMKAETTYTEAEWNFDTTWAISPDINDGYPYFQSLDIIVSVEEETTTEKLAAANIYPNPANDFINISLGEEGIIKSVEIIDLKGVLIKKEIFNVPASRISLTVNTIPAGYYIIRISSEKEVFALPLVIE